MSIDPALGRPRQDCHTLEVNLDYNLDPVKTKNKTKNPKPTTKGTHTQRKSEI